MIKTITCIWLAIAHAAMFVVMIFVETLNESDEIYIGFK